MNFTKDQQEVILSRNQNLLVSAAAGSGKTAVLVARIIKRIMDTEHPTDIDRMLVMTFTEAAAGEMKERISNAIAERLREQPNDKHLQKQSLLIHNAPITTIHGFCLNVVKNHFHEIDIDPGFRVADEGECKLLKADVMEKLLEVAYENADDDFVHMAECYGAQKTDTAIEGLVDNLYMYAMSHPYPDNWLQTCKQAYCLEEAMQMDDCCFTEDILLDISNTLIDVRGQAENVLRICLDPDGPYMYEKAIQTDIKMIDELLCCHTYSQYKEAISMLAFEKLGRSKSGDMINPAKKSIAKNLRDNYKGIITNIKSQYFFDTEDNLLRDMNLSKRAVDVLVNLTGEFIKAYEQAKREKNIIDFDDMEHMALRILLTRESGELHTTKTANEYRDYFSEILVDEYQDSNLVQEYLINSISKESIDLHNVFMVGDVKQSIYRFRLARPELFMDKYHKYPIKKTDIEDASSLPCMRIDLHQNFRSRKNVLYTVNDIFSQIMRPEIGGIAYDDAAALYYGADFPENLQSEQQSNIMQCSSTEQHALTEQCSSTEQQLIPTQQPSILSSQTEYLLIEYNAADYIAPVSELGQDEDLKTDAIDKRELEAKVIAERIQRLVNSEQIWDRKKVKYRGVTYADIVILLRSNKGYDETYKRILEEAGIPVYVASKTGYFSVPEIETLLAFLRILDNPLQDIPLAASMKSVFGGFNDEELAKIRCASKKFTLYDAVCEFAKENLQSILTNKVNTFLSLMQYYRDKMPYTSVYYLMSELLLKTGYIYYVAASPNGEQKKANVNMLLEKANAYGKTSYKGLFHFIKYIEYLQRYDVDYGEASLANENDNAVRIMSIHKSKGLEFPICFLAATDKQINSEDKKKSVILDADYGIGVDFIDPVKRVKSQTLLKCVMQKKAKTETLAEELRLLYVALTRAEQKIIMTGVVKDFSKELQKYCSISDSREAQISATTISGMKSFEDMLMYSFIRHPAMQSMLEEYGLPICNNGKIFHSDVQITCLDVKSIVESQLRETIMYDTIKKRLLSEESADTPIISALIDRKFSFRYSYETDKDKRMKISVSELKKRHMTEELPEGEELLQNQEIVPYIPNFIQESQEVSAVQRGTAYHKVLELINYEEAFEQQIEQIITAGLITAEAGNTINLDEMNYFFASKLAQRMKTAAIQGKLYREQPFVVYDKDEDILIQGIIDAYFVEDDEIVVVDYKTDRVNRSEELIERYKVQLDYYAKALKQLTGMRVKEEVIYSFTLNQDLEM